MPGITYLASPYSHPNPVIRELRFEIACHCAGALMGKGKIVFSPIAHNHPIEVRSDLPKGWDFWKAYDFEFLARCEEMLILKIPGWNESVGVTDEMEIARGLGLAIGYV